MLHNRLKPMVYNENILTRSLFAFLKFSNWNDLIEMVFHQISEYLIVVWICGVNKFFLQNQNLRSSFMRIDKNSVSGFVNPNGKIKLLWYFLVFWVRSVHPKENYKFKRKKKSNQQRSKIQQAQKKYYRGIFNSLSLKTLRCQLAS